jgi:SPP1 gp7 family putative phage head morphogenesis protein
MTMPLNQRIADALVERQIQDARAETHHRLALWASLAVLEADILAVLKVADPTAFQLLRRRQQAVELVMQDIAILITTRYARLAEETTAFLVQLALQEARAVRRLINATLAEEATHEMEGLDEVPPVEIVRRAVTDTLIPTATRPTDLSATGAAWWERQASSLTQRVHDQLMVSVALGETTTHMTQRIRGTSEQGFRDGVMQRAREDAARLLRTQVTNAVSEARVAVAEANVPRMVLMHQSVLDSRTSFICLGRNGLRYEPITHQPIGHTVPYLTGAPYHPQCRSTIIPVVRTGSAVKQESADAWLRRRDTAYQDAVLGPTRAVLFRQGRLGLHDLLDSLTGRPLTLEELGA